MTSTYGNETPLFDYTYNLLGDGTGGTVSVYGAHIYNQWFVVTSSDITESLAKSDSAWMVVKALSIDVDASSEIQVGSRLFSEWYAGTNTNWTDKFFQVPAGSHFTIGDLNLVLPMEQVGAARYHQPLIAQNTGSPQSGTVWANFHVYSGTNATGLDQMVSKGVVLTTTDTAGEVETVVQVPAGKTLEINRIFMWGECTTTELFYAATEAASGTIIYQVDADDSWTGASSFRDRIDIKCSVRIRGGSTGQYIRLSGSGATAGDANCYIEGRYI